MKILNKAKERYSYSIILLRQLVKTDFKLRYQGSTLGYFWSLLKPLLLFLILYIVFAKFLKVGDSIPHFPVYLLTGIVLWNYFTEITSGSIGAIVGRGDLIRKINFPKYIIVISGCVSAFINLVLNFVVIAIFMLVTGVDTSWGIVLVIPLILELTVFALGIAFFLSAAFVRFRDISYIWEVLMQGAFYATPILYPVTLIPEFAQKILLLNPVAQVIQDVRQVLVTPDAITVGDAYGNGFAVLIPIAIVILVAAGGILYFKSRSKYFAEEV